MPGSRGPPTPARLTQKKEEEEGREKSFIVIFESFINYCESDFLFVRFRIFGPKVRNYYSKGFSLGKKCETKRRRSKGVSFSDATLLNL
jgi:hypothetical protein